jgi:hypothetical protein
MLAGEGRLRDEGSDEKGLKGQKKEQRFEKVRFSRN